MGPNKIAEILECPIRFKESYEIEKIPAIQDGSEINPVQPFSGITSPDWIEQRTKIGKLYHAILQFCVAVEGGFELARDMLNQCNYHSRWTEEFKSNLIQIDSDLEFYDYKKQRRNELRSLVDDFGFFLEDISVKKNHHIWKYEEKISGTFTTPHGPWQLRGKVDLKAEFENRIVIVEIKSKKINYHLEEWANQLLIYEQMMVRNPNINVDSYIFWPNGYHKIDDSDRTFFEQKMTVEDCDGCRHCQT